MSRCAAGFFGLKTWPGMLVLLLLATYPRWATAAGANDHGPAREAAQAKGAPAPKERQRVTPEREAAAMTFARHNAPQLVELLDYLRRKRPRQYRRAVLDLFRTSERLATIQERDPERYALELEIWKTRSHIELIVARLHVHESKPLRAELEREVTRLIGMHRMLLQRDRKRIQQRLDRIDHEIDALNPSDDNVIQRHVNAFLQNRGRSLYKTKKTPLSPAK